MADLERWSDTTGVVLDAIGAPRATLFTFDLGGLPAMLFAATHPERVSGIALMGCFARLGRADDYPWGMPPDTLRKSAEVSSAMWGSGTIQQFMAPSYHWDEVEVAQAARYERLAASPGAFGRVIQMTNQADVRGVLSSIRCPALIMQRTGDRYIRPGNGRYLAEHIAGARYLELPGDDHYPFAGDSDTVLREIRSFVGSTEEVEETDRVLATVMFTDIVGSTEAAARLGDKRWREVLDAHDDLLRQSIRKYNGREVKTTGDGVLATFDGPGRAIRCASTIVERAPRVGVDVRAGLHTGECELRGKDVGGIAVHIGSRVSSLAGAGEVLVSGTVRDLVVGSGFDFVDRGTHELKGVPGEWRLFALAREDR
jgi:class 3 adenylate cyclase